MAATINEPDQPDQFEFWMVWCPKGRAPTAKHGSHEQAKREAERLSKMNPNESFYILRAEGYVRTIAPTQFYKLTDIPF